MFTVHHENRIRWAYAVRWKGGRTACRCDGQREAYRIAYALNNARDLDAPLTPAEVAAVEHATGADS